MSYRPFMLRQVLHHETVHFGTLTLEDPATGMVGTVNRATSTRRFAP